MHAYVVPQESSFIVALFVGLLCDSLVIYASAHSSDITGVVDNLDLSKKAVICVHIFAFSCLDELLKKSYFNCHLLKIKCL